MAQRTIFSQVIKLIPRSEFEGWVDKHQADYRIRKLNSWTWFGSLLFSQLTGHDSIRAIERVFASGQKSMKSLGFGEVKRSTISDANTNRTLGVLEECFLYVLRRAQQQAPHKTGFRFLGNVWAMDTTIIQLCLSLCPWAKYDGYVGAVKLHTAIDVANQLPQFAVMTEGRVSDYKGAREICDYPKGTTLVFDKAYMGYPFLNDLNQSGVSFVTRAKANCKFKVLESRECDKSRGIKCDQEVYTTTRFGRQYRGTMRRVSYRDPETGKRLVFLTNRFDLVASTICALYKARWKVEVFFKTMKQNLRVKKFLGTSMNAVKAQILVALIAYLLIQLIRFGYRVRTSIPDTMAVIGTMLLLKEQLALILGELPCTTRYPPQSQLDLGL